MFHSSGESEKYFERKFEQRVKALGGLCLKLLPFNFTGLPDRLVLLPGGRIFFCEIKSTGYERSGRQLLVHKKLIQLGFKSYLIDSMEIINYLTGDNDRL